MHLTIDACAHIHISGEKVVSVGEEKGSVLEKKVKKKLTISIPLSKEEIDEDIFDLTGSRPKKSLPKNTETSRLFVSGVGSGINNSRLIQGACKLLYEVIVSNMPFKCASLKVV